MKALYKEYWNAIGGKWMPWIFAAVVITIPFTEWFFVMQLAVIATYFGFGLSLLGDSAVDSERNYLDLIPVNVNELKKYLAVRFSGIALMGIASAVLFWLAAQAGLVVSTFVKINVNHLLTICCPYVIFLLHGLYLLTTKNQRMGWDGLYLGTFFYFIIMIMFYMQMMSKDQIDVRGYVLLSLMLALVYLACILLNKSIKLNHIFKNNTLVELSRIHYKDAPLFITSLGSISGAWIANLGNIVRMAEDFNFSILAVLIGILFSWSRLVPLYGKITMLKILPIRKSQVVRAYLGQIVKSMLFGIIGLGIMNLLAIFVLRGVGFFSSNLFQWNDLLIVIVTVLYYYGCSLFLYRISDVKWLNIIIQAFAIIVLFVNLKHLLVFAGIGCLLIAAGCLDFKR